MHSHERVETRGSLDRAALEDGVLILEGWAFSSGRAIDSFGVSVGDKTFNNVEVAINLPSKDVADVFRASAGGASRVNPGRGLPSAAMAQVENCRFRIRVPLTAAVQERIRTSIIGLSPRVGRREGNLLLNLVEPYLPPPPQEFTDFVGGGYHGVSVSILGNLIQWGGLKPDMDVLDAGCGVGRMAYSLAHYLNPTARYEGFDIAVPLIRWAQENTTSRFPNFNFRPVDIYNKHYNPGGSIQGIDFRFPYENESFDFVFSISLFTHLLAADARHYLDESFRVLRPGGRCFHTMFLLNRESKSLIRAGKSVYNLVHPVGECFSNSAEVPEGAVGYPERLMLDFVAERGFTVREKYSGEWCGRPPRRFWFMQRRAG
jgi:ubiquinone/menaquinone biosynthesis C-methylase UbiE